MKSHRFMGRVPRRLTRIRRKFVIKGEHFSSISAARWSRWNEEKIFRAGEHARQRSLRSASLKTKFLSQDGVLGRKTVKVVARSQIVRYLSGRFKWLPTVNLRFTCAGCAKRTEASRRSR